MRKKIVLLLCNTYKFMFFEAVVKAGGAIFQRAVSIVGLLSASMATYMFFSLIKIILSLNLSNGNIELLHRYKNYHNYNEQYMYTRC